MVQFTLQLAQCVPTEASKTTDISGTEINNRIEETDQAIYCAITQGFYVENPDGDDETATGILIGESSLEPVEGGQQVTTWIVEIPQCLEDCDES
jgi:hypothetical protein